MNQTLGNILFFAGLAGAILAVILDALSSKDFEYFGLTERNSKSDDKHGFFALNRNLILSGACIAASAIAGFVGMSIGEQGAYVTSFGGVLLGVPTGLRGWAYFENKRAKKRGRAAQTAFLKTLREYQSFEKPVEEMPLLFNGQVTNERGGRTFYLLFGWIYSENPDYHSAVAEIQKKLADLSLKDEARWFPK